MNAPSSARGRLERAIEGEDPREGMAEFSLCYKKHQEMILSLLEWALQMNESSKGLFTQDEMSKVRSISAQKWRASFHAEGDPGFRVRINPGLRDEVPLSSVDALQNFLEPVGKDQLLPEEYRRRLSVDPAQLISEVAPEVTILATRLMQAIDKHSAETSSCLDQYWHCVVSVHDAVISYIDCYLTEVLRKFGQAKMEELLQKSVLDCPSRRARFLKGLEIPERQLAEFLKENLTAHFSGPNREGEVELREDEDSYHLIMSLCGTGGVLREQVALGRREGEVCPQASEMTWDRKAEVPPYCTHCAFNEIACRQLGGYSPLQTRFVPGPQGKCEWVILKKGKSK